MPPSVTPAPSAGSGNGGIIVTVFERCCSLAVCTEVMQNYDHRGSC